MNPNLKYQMKNKVYVFHCDPGHGWVAVKKKELDALGITGVSQYSYVKGETVYLEEDCDLSLFIAAYEKTFGNKPKFRESYLERTPIRYYERFVNSSPSVSS